MKQQAQVSKYYLKYKKMIFPAVFLGLSVFLLLVVVFPQISSISSMNQDISTREAKVQTLQSSLSTLSSQPDLQPDFDLVNRALPPAKNIASIFNALISASADSNTTVQDFSVKIGGVYGRSARADSGVAGVPFINLVTRISGDSAADVISFSKVIQERLPLAEVTTIDSSKNEASFQISFFYKFQDLSVLAKQESVAPLSASDKSLIERLKAWDK